MPGVAELPGPEDTPWDQINGSGQREARHRQPACRRRSRWMHPTRSSQPLMTTHHHVRLRVVKYPSPDSSRPGRPCRWNGSRCRGGEVRVPATRRVAAGSRGEAVRSGMRGGRVREHVVGCAGRPTGRVVAPGLSHDVRGAADRLRCVRRNFASGHHTARVRPRWALQPVVPARRRMMVMSSSGGERLIVRLSWSKTVIEVRVAARHQKTRGDRRPGPSS